MAAVFLGGPERTSAFRDSFVKAPTIVWARVDTTGGSQRSGGAVVDDDIAVAVGSGYRCEVAALDAETGATRWRVDPPTSLKQTSARTGTLLANGVVYFGSNEGLHALDATDGSQRWLAKIRGLYGAPLAIGDTIVVGAYSDLYAFDHGTGRKAWKHPLGAQVACAIAYRDETLYCVGDESLIALDAATRTVRWALPAMSRALTAGPAVTVDRVVFVSIDGGLACADRATGALQWTATCDSIRAHPFAVSSDRIVVKTLAGRLECFDLATGALLWSSAGGRDKPVSLGHCGPIIAGTTVVCVMVDNSRARCTLTGLDLATGALLWELEAPEGTWSWYCTPVVRAGLLYVQTDTGLVALH